MNNPSNTSKFVTNRSEAMREKWQDPVFRARQEQAAALRAEKQREHWQDPDYRTRVQTTRSNNREMLMIKRMQKGLQQTLGEFNAK